MITTSSKIAYCLALFLLCSVSLVFGAGKETVDFDLKAKEIAMNCRDEVTQEFNILLNANRINLVQLFDTFYIPIPNTSPQKYTTQYDRLTDQVLPKILDRYLAMDDRLLFVVAVDKNGYVPTHNTKYSKPLTDDPDYNAKNNRAKRLFNDRTGLAAAKNTAPFLLQKYSRDTGEELFDVSVPIMIKDKRWGAIRVGYTK